MYNMSDFTFVTIIYAYCTAKYSFFSRLQSSYSRSNISILYLKIIDVNNRVLNSYIKKYKNY